MLEKIRLCAGPEVLGLECQHAADRAPDLGSELHLGPKTLVIGVLGQM